LVDLCSWQVLPSQYADRTVAHGASVAHVLRPSQADWDFSKKVFEPEA
jgi:uncharacterized protein (UPF0261 family)